jgi:hypothetical protein
MVLLYFDQYKALPEDIRDVRRQEIFTAEGISKGLGIPIAAVYRAKDALLECSYIAAHPMRSLLDGKHRVWLYSATPKGRGHAAAFRTFQQTVEALR